MGWRQKLDTYLGIRAPGGRGQVTIDANTGTTSTLTVDSLAAGAGTVGTTELADDAVTLAKLADIARGSIIVGGASNAPTALSAKTSGQILVGDGTDLASVAVSGDVTMASTGAVTVGPGKITNTMLAGSIAATKCLQQFVVATATLTSAAGSTPVEIVADATVGAGRAFYLCGWRAVVNGGTLWGTVTNVYIKDNAGSPVTLVDIPVAALGANAIVGELTANVALGTPVITGAGATTAKGLSIVANATGTGSDLLVTVWGLVK